MDALQLIRQNLTNYNIMFDHRSYDDSLCRTNSTNYEWLQVDENWLDYTPISGLVLNDWSNE